MVLICIVPWPTPIWTNPLICGCYLKILDHIHHCGLHICLGPFGTPHVQSMQMLVTFYFLFESSLWKPCLVFCFSFSACHPVCHLCQEAYIHLYHASFTGFWSGYLKGNASSPASSSVDSSFSRDSSLFYNC